MKILQLCQADYERFLIGELEESGRAVVRRSGPGFVHSEWSEEPEADVLEGFCFPHLTVIDPVEVAEESVNAMAGRLMERMAADFRELRFDGPWYFDAWVRRDLDGLGRRATGVRRALAEKLKTRMGRVAKLGGQDFPATPGPHRGWGMFFEDFGRIFASSRLVFGGQQRMADDPAAPSRSYLKVEEAYKVLGLGPVEGERVVDLGAAPGGWSYSAARRGAKVVAVDNGPLKAGAAEHRGIEHRREDGFRFRPAEGEDGFDWMFCDMVEDPFRVLRLLEQWVVNDWCRKFVVNLKFGRADPVALLKEVAIFRAGPLREWTRFRARHLFHDREEITLAGARE